MFTCKIISEDMKRKIIEYSVTTDECYINISENIISADSKFGRALYDSVNSGTDIFLWNGVKYRISDVKRHRTFKEMKIYRSPEGKMIKEVIESNKVKYLVHFTRIENLSSILENGILSIKELNIRGLEYFNNDFGRYDGRRDCSCFSVEFPNDSLLKAFRKNQNDGKWVILLVDVDVLIFKKSKKYFCMHNAASKGISSQIKYGQLCSAEDFEKMFSAHIEYSKRDGNYSLDRVVDKSYLATSNQAEILIEGIIEREYIRGIITATKNDERFVESILNKYCTEERIESILEPRYFVERDKVKFKER